jgi:ubiquinone/menaquinone biosynthesis C-methylase UbiE
MDREGVDAGELNQSLKYIRWVNRTFGYTRSVLTHFQRFSASWRKGERIEVVDFATGSGDIPVALVRWGQGAGFDVRVVGVDRHPVTTGVAKRMVADCADVRDAIRIVQGDVFAAPFEERSFDYAMTAMFLHHLDEAEIVGVLRTMDRVARRGIVVADLLRTRRAKVWVGLLTACSSPMIRHDAVVSVKQALNRREAEAMRDAAGVRYAGFYRHFGHRFVLAGEKREQTGPSEVA